MTTSTPHTLADPATTDPVAQRVLRFLQERLKTSFAPDEDLFAAGGVSSLFAMELVLFLEREFSIAVTGPELKLDNFRSAEAMAALIHRLDGTMAGGG